MSPTHPVNVPAYLRVYVDLPRDVAHALATIPRLAAQSKRALIAQAVIEFVEREKESIARMNAKARKTAPRKASE